MSGAIFRGSSEHVSKSEEAKEQHVFLWSQQSEKITRSNLGSARENYLNTSDQLKKHFRSTEETQIHKQALRSSEEMSKRMIHLSNR